jgi:hypothetical protein
MLVFPLPGRARPRSAGLSWNPEAFAVGDGDGASAKNVPDRLRYQRVDLIAGVRRNGSPLRKVTDSVTRITMGPPAKACSKPLRGQSQMHRTNHSLALRGRPVHSGFVASGDLRRLAGAWMRLQMPAADLSMKSRHTAFAGYALRIACPRCANGLQRGCDAGYKRAGRPSNVLPLAVRVATRVRTAA